MNLKENKIKQDKRNEARTCYIMLGLPLIGLFVFTVYNILWSIGISFFSYTGVPSSLKFVGLAQYAKVFQDATYWKTWIVNLEYAFLKTPLEMLIGFVLANFLIRDTKFAGFYRAIYYLPAVVSVAIIGLIFSNLFDYYGIINAWLQKLGIIDKPIEWFASTATSMFTLLAGALWQTLGGTILHFMAGLSTVPKDVYESADIDGAGRLTKMFKISLPMIMPMFQVMLLLAITGVLNVNDYVLVMTNGAPAGTTYTIQAYLASKVIAGFGELANIGYAAAMSIVASIICCIIGVSFNKLSDKLQNLY